MGEVQDVLSSRGYAWLDGATSSAVGAQLGRTGPSEVLAPRERAAADPWSLSGAYGLRAFPWHTDGAIASKPPRWLLLRAVRLSRPTCTELLDPHPELLAVLRRTVLRVTDRAGRVRHLPAAVYERDGWRLRWDPRTCRPRVGIPVEEMEKHPPSATIEWRRDCLLVVDNTRLLHRRPAVDGLAERLIERTYVWDD